MDEPTTPQGLNAEDTGQGKQGTNQRTIGAAVVAYLVAHGAELRVDVENGNLQVRGSTDLPTHARRLLTRHASAVVASILLDEIEQLIATAGGLRARVEEFTGAGLAARPEPRETG